MLASILILLAGVGVFIAGMNMLGDGLEKSAGKGMKGLLGRISNNRLAGVGIGAGVTAIIQSSSATSVMVIGFVNAGIMTLTQATSIVMSTFRLLMRFSRTTMSLQVCTTTSTPTRTTLS